MRSSTFELGLSFKETPKKSKTTKEATKESKHDVTDGHENEAQSPCKNLQGRPICSPKNLDFSRLRNQIRMRSLVPRERNNMSLLIFLNFSKKTLTDMTISERGSWNKMIELNVALCDYQGEARRVAEFEGDSYEERMSDNSPRTIRPDSRLLAD